MDGVGEVALHAGVGVACRTDNGGVGQVAATCWWNKVHNDDPDSSDGEEVLRLGIR